MSLVDGLDETVNRWRRYGITFPDDPRVHVAESPYVYQDEQRVLPGMKQKILVNKQTHRIRFEDETESSVTIVVEPKD